MRKDLKYKEDERRKDGHMHAASFSLFDYCSSRKNTGLQASLRCLFRNVKKEETSAVVLAEAKKARQDATTCYCGRAAQRHAPPLRRTVEPISIRLVLKLN